MIMSNFKPIKIHLKQSYDEQYFTLEDISYEMSYEMTTKVLCKILYIPLDGKWLNSLTTLAAGLLTILYRHCSVWTK